VKWKEARAALAKRTPEQGRKMVAPIKPVAAPKANRAELSAEQMDLGEGWSHVARGGELPRPALLNLSYNQSLRHPPSHK